jgi:hypothetical protein
VDIAPRDRDETQERTEAGTEAGTDAEAEADDESARGGYLFHVAREEPAVALTVSIPAMRSEELPDTVPSRELEPGAYYLLGGPGQLTCEVVQVVADEPPATSTSRRVRRGRCRTIPSPHPVGTPVTRVTAEFVEDWRRWEATDDAARSTAH